VRVVMVVVTMMAMAGRKRRAGKRQKDQGGKQNLFHATNVAWTLRRGKSIPRGASKEALGVGNRPGLGAALTLLSARSA
jgi:hypothetical protein